jgi:hypothetical protein
LDYNQQLFAPTMRYDVINGVRKPPVVDVANSYFRRNTRSTNGTVTPQYGKKRAQKTWLPENPYTLSQEVVKFPYGVPFLKLTWIPTGDYSVYYGPTRNGVGSLTYLQPSQSAIDGAINQVKLSLREKIQGQKVHLGNFIAQRHQMIDEFSSTARRIARAYKSLRKGNIPGAYKALGCGPSGKVNPYQSAASNWLALQYGWLPLLSDLYGVAEELRENMIERVKRPPIMKAVSKRRLHDGDLYVHARDGVDHKGAKATREYISDFRGRINYTVDVEGAHLLSEVGLTNPLAIAWEVLPYSFVVDWFAPVGRWINTFDATLGCTFVSGTIGTTVDTVFRWTNVDKFQEGSYLYEYLGCIGYGRQFTYKRVVLAGFPVVYLPQPKDPFSKGHVLNALALLTQAFF